jgi:hypothetical protein
MTDTDLVTSITMFLVTRMVFLSGVNFDGYIFLLERR